MADKKSVEKKAGKFSSIEQIHWVAGLAVAVILSFVFSLIATAITNQWALLVVLNIFCLVIAGAVGFAVRLTSSASSRETFVTALVTGGLGVMVVVRMSGQGYSDLAWNFINAYNGSILSGWVVFFGLVAALVATVARKK